MRILLLAVLLLMGWAPAVPAAELTPADRTLIRQVIEDQIQAFRNDDGERAFSFAAPGIRTMFGTPERFMAMVRGSYPQVYRPREVAFRELQVIEDEIVQPVTMVGPDGVPVVAIYKMEWQEGDRVWRINGCFLLPSPDKAT
jgi:hypothetical protein